MMPPETSPVGLLLLSRLLLGGDRGATFSQIKKDVEPLLRHRWEGAALTDLRDRTLDELRSAGLIERTRKGKADRGLITAAGCDRVLGWLGLGELPPKTTWGGLKANFLTARALGLPAPSGEGLKAFKGQTGFKAALLKRQFGLTIDDFPKKLDQAENALAWRLIGLDSGERFNLKNVLARLIARELGDGRPADPKKAVDRLLARSIGARRDDAKEFRDASIRRWVDEGDASPGPPRHVPAAADAATAAPDLGEFARRALDAARSSPTGRFGANKVFIVHAWRASRADPLLGGMPLDQFKRRLTEANRARLLDLGRADLVEAMDPGDVRDSEADYLGATFHFIRI